MTRRPTTRPVLLAALAALAAALLFAIAGAHTAPPGGGSAGGGSRQAGAALPAASQSTAPTRPPPRIGPITTSLGVVGVIGAVLATALGLGVLARLVWWVATNIRTGRWRGLRRPAAQVDDRAADDLDLVRRIDDAVDAGLAELEQPGRPVSDSVIACWLRLAAASAEAGVEPHASDTPEETITRVGMTAGIPAKPLVTLAELYREARFSRHPMGPQQAEAARGALTVILARLRQRAHAPN